MPVRVPEEDQFLHPNRPMPSALSSQTQNAQVSQCLHNQLQRCPLRMFPLPSSEPSSSAIKVLSNKYATKLSVYSTNGRGASIDTRCFLAGLGVIVKLLPSSRFLNSCSPSGWKFCQRSSNKYFNPQRWYKLLLWLLPDSFCKKSPQLSKILHIFLSLQRLHFS